MDGVLLMTSPNKDRIASNVDPNQRWQSEMKVRRRSYYTMHPIPITEGDWAERLVEPAWL